MRVSEPRMAALARIVAVAPTACEGDSTTFSHAPDRLYREQVNSQLYEGGPHGQVGMDSNR